MKYESVVMTDGGANVENAGGTVMHSTGGMQEASSKETVEASSIQKDAGWQNNRLSEQIDTTAWKGTKI